jgi:two-component system LytT family sensor kinase
VKPRFNANPFWILHLSGWTGYGLVMFLATVPYLPLADAALNKGIYTAIGFLLNFPLWWLCRRLWRSPKWSWTLAATLLPVCYALALTWSWTSSAAFFIASGQPLASVPWTRYFQHATTQTLAYITWSAFYFGVKQFLSAQQIREQALKAEALAKEARLQALRYQLNPHFLFNSLNTIASLVLDGQNEQAHRTILRLSQLLRSTLEGGTSDHTTVRAEAEFLEQYLGIEAERFSDHLRFHFQLEPDVLDHPVPHLILQPLVENAIRHGIGKPNYETAVISIAGRHDQGFLELSVADNGVGLAATEGNGVVPPYGIGLSNTRDRLLAAYGPSATLALESNRPHGVVARVRIPVEATRAKVYPA